MVDARDPLRYRSEDMEAYSRELNPAKAPLLLLNKADLLPRPLRAAWAAHFQRARIDFLFWSAKAAAEGATDTCTAPLLSFVRAGCHCERVQPHMPCA